MDRGAWQAAVHGLQKSQTRLSNKTTTANPTEGFTAVALSEAFGGSCWV